MKTPTWSVAAVVLSIVVLSPFLSGCRATYLAVDSSPRGADILLNEKSIGEKTPASIRLRSIPYGHHWLTVKKDGYRCTTPPQPVSVRFNPGTVVFAATLGWTPFPWIRIANDSWKGLYKPSPRRGESLPLYVLEKEPLKPAEPTTKETVSAVDETPTSLDAVDSTSVEKKQEGPLTALGPEDHATAGTIKEPREKDPR